MIPELPHSSQWKEGERLTPENVKHLAPGTAIATFTNGRYGNAPHGNHAGIFLGAGTDKFGQLGIRVLDQYDGTHGEGQAQIRFYPFSPSRRSHYLATAFSVIH